MADAARSDLRKAKKGGVKKSPGQDYYNEESEDTEAKETSPRVNTDKKDERWSQKSKRAKKSDDDEDMACSDDEDDEDGNEDMKRADDEDDEDGNEDMKKKAKKGGLQPMTLRKALNGLAAYIQETDPQSRKEILLEKALKGQLRKSEQQELMAIMGGEVEETSSTADRMEKSLNDNSDVQDVLVLNDYIAGHHQALTKSLGELGDAIDGLDGRQEEFNILLAKSVHTVGTMVQSIAETIGAIAQQPAREPKSRGVTPLNKGFAGTAPQGEELTKSDILGTLGALNEASWKSPDPATKGLSKSGEPYDRAIAKFEQTGMISPALRDEVIAQHRSRSN